MICLAVIPTYIAVFSLAQRPALSCRPSPGAAEALLPVVYQQRCHRQSPPPLIYGCLSVVTTSTLQQMGFRYLLSERTLLNRSDTINKIGITIYSIEIDGIPMVLGYNLLMCHTVEWSGRFGVCCSDDHLLQSVWAHICWIREPLNIYNPLIWFTHIYSGIVKTFLRLSCSTGLSP